PAAGVRIAVDQLGLALRSSRENNLLPHACCNVNPSVAAIDEMFNRLSWCGLHRSLLVSPISRPISTASRIGLLPVALAFGPHRTRFLQSVMLASTQVETVPAVPRLDGERMMSVETRRLASRGQDKTGEWRRTPSAACSTASSADRLRPASSHARESRGHQSSSKPEIVRPVEFAQFLETTLPLSERTARTIMARSTRQ